MFDLSPIDSIGGEISEVTLEITIATDDGDGTINVYTGDSTEWSEDSFSQTTAPVTDTIIGTSTNNYKVGQTEEIHIEETKINEGTITLILIHENGDDLAFASKEHESEDAPRLVVTYLAPQDASAIAEDFTENTVTDDLESPNPQEEGEGEDNSSEGDLTTNEDNDESSPEQPQENQEPESPEVENEETNSLVGEDEQESSTEETEETDSTGSNEEEDNTVPDETESEEVQDGNTGSTNEENNAPNARAEATPKEGTAPLKVTFNSDNSSDDIAITGFNWNFGDGNTSKEKNPVHTFEKAGEYDVVLTVSDEQGESDRVNLKITVSESKQAAPVAKIKASKTSGEAPLKIDFSGDDSSDADDNIENFSWDFGNGQKSSSKNASATFEKAGTYKVTLKVEDETGLTDEENITITVSEAENEAPKAAMSADRTSGELPLDIQFKGSNSSDDKEIKGYFWDFKDGSTSSSSNPKHTYTKAGTYKVELTVEDEEGLKDTQSITITVNERQNEAPTARLSASPTSGEAPLDVQFKGSDSSDDDEIETYTWDFKDGSTATSPNPSHTFDNPGTYQVSLTVKDSDGSTDTKTITIEVSEKASSGGGGNTGNYPSNAVFASDFGFNSSDSSDAFEAALRSGSSYVVIDKQSSDWIIRPTRIFDLTNVTVVFEPGVVLRAKPGAYSDGGAKLFELYRPRDVVIEGNGATFRMNKSEYNSGEGRHALSIRQGENVTIKNLTIRDSGGDGIYIAGGNNRNYSRDITIENVTCDNNRRQGMSIISAENVYVRNSTFKGSSGTNPEAGVALEPNASDERLVNINFSNCVFTRNDSMGFLLSTGKLNSSSTPISVSVKDSEFSYNSDAAASGIVNSEIILSQGQITNPVRGDVKFERIYFNGSNNRILMYRNASDAYDVQFKDCTAKNVARRENRGVIELQALSIENSIGGISFDNFRLEYSNNTPFLRIEAPSSGTVLRDVSGDFIVDEPYDNPITYSGGYDEDRNINVNISYRHID
tara:strand:- start:4605 stop:7619 length:3015 start_codon:yes stop_codon:yes gene_type:complete